MRAIGILTWLSFLGFGVAQIIVGFIGIEHHLGTVWAWIAVSMAFLIRFTLPITVGSFFGGLALGWHWGLALLFAAPGMLLAVPGAIAACFALAADRARSNPR